ncbi:teichoic acid D-Ala incorporation-associated protein DltX [Lapidilactobacillus achengensis]|uniref:Teichoic acid D-Ala incorporation-associated protein DltX n=1 Tax=Lapidilactobacillus achengensis TaxID=2486000 RepID=A0ABW1USR2_9LACO|nr:teichoic acid D-Ala incorporation-associated protein DltX [Lapidilactobacillus achengensis]
MVEKKQSQKKQIGRFILRTVFYFLIILVLVYLYGYSGINGGHFIYNEF